MKPRQTRHFLALSDFSTAQLRALIRRGAELKQSLRAGERPALFERRVLGMLFEKSSTRTRVSFETAMLQGGGGAIFLAPGDTQIGRGEPLEDTARVLSSMVDAIVVRTFGHAALERFAAVCTVPVINALTDRFHPCQLLADLQTYFELRGDIAGRSVAWIGDGNNMCHTWLEAATLLDFELRVCCPPGHQAEAELLRAHADHLRLFDAPLAAAQRADLIVTDVWASMGQESEQELRARTFADYQVSARVMAEAAPDALFMHCLPAHRGEEVSAEVIDGPQSAVWIEAENRLHAQKALLEFFLNPSGA